MDGQKLYGLAVVEPEAGRIVGDQLPDQQGIHHREDAYVLSPDKS